MIALARRRVQAFATDEMLEELRGLTRERQFKCPHPPQTMVDWYCERVRRVDPAPLGKQRSRDAKDDPYLACALAAGAKIVVSRDDDLLTLEKPFGIEIITPRELLARLAKAPA
ncbi:MAG: PIN domain-containing protein [Verrucomicrobiota bacterium]|nr:PIN domain-containing protein [Verrucomicrobiota bacterium]